MRKIKLALVYDAIYPYIKGGAEKRYFEIAKRLTKRGFEVHLYGMKYWTGPNVIEKDGVHLHGISKARPLYTKNGRRSITQAILFGLSSFKLNREEFDVIDCCGFPYFSLFACKLVCIVKRKKLYSTWHEVWGRRYWKEYLGALAIFGILIEKIAVKLSDEIIAVSPRTGRRIKNELGYRKKIAVIPNGIDFELINTIKPSREKSDVIYAGRLMDFKNINILIKSIKILKKKNENIKCLIIGDGPERKRLEKLTRELNLTKNIMFKGFLKTERELFSLFKSSKVFVLPSVREGFGLVAIEANACGIPVITVNHKDNATKDLISKKNGAVVNVDEKEIASSINKILDKKLDPVDFINFVKNYDWNRTMDQIEEVYK